MVLLEETHLSPTESQKKELDEKVVFSSGMQNPKPNDYLTTGFNKHWQSHERAIGFANWVGVENGRGEP